MTQATEGDTVQIHYTGKLPDGTVVSTSQGKQPVQFTIGEGKVIPGLEKAIVGMAQGESKSVEIPAAQGFGPRRQDLVVQVDRSQVPDSTPASVGQRLPIQLRTQGKPVQAVVIDVSEDRLTLDANHPLAGKNLNFDVELIKVS